MPSFMYFSVIVTLVLNNHGRNAPFEEVSHCLNPDPLRGMRQLCIATTECIYSSVAEREAGGEGGDYRLSLCGMLVVWDTNTNLANPPKDLNITLRGRGNLQPDCCHSIRIPHVYNGETRCAEAHPDIASAGLIVSLKWTYEQLCKLGCKCNGKGKYSSTSRGNHPRLTAIPP
jgi:hypothetical protein